MIKFQGDNASGSRSQRTGIPFLKVENVSPTPKPCKILAVKQGKDNKGKDQVMLKINYSGPVYLWSLRLNNPNVQHLIGMFGEDESAWKDQEFLLGLEPDEFSGRNWPRAFPMPNSTPRKATRS